MRRRAMVALVVGALVVVPSAAGWSWPVEGDVVQSFDFDRSHPYAGGQHRGIDIAAPSGATVVAPAAGSVTFAGTVPSSGKTIAILSGEYSVTLTELGSIEVAKGDAVAEGQRVATSGSSGVVHLGVRVASDDQGYVDPLSLLPARDGAGAGGVSPAEDSAASGRHAASGSAEPESGGSEAGANGGGAVDTDAPEGAPEPATGGDGSDAEGGGGKPASDADSSAAGAQTPHGDAKGTDAPASDAPSNSNTGSAEPAPGEPTIAAPGAVPTADAPQGARATGTGSVAVPEAVPPAVPAVSAGMNWTLVLTWPVAERSAASRAPRWEPAAGGKQVAEVAEVAVAGVPGASGGEREPVRHEPRAAYSTAVVRERSQRSDGILPAVGRVAHETQGTATVAGLALLAAAVTLAAGVARRVRRPAPEPPPERVVAVHRRTVRRRESAIAARRRHKARHARTVRTQTPRRRAVVR